MQLLKGAANPCSTNQYCNLGAEPSRFSFSSTYKLVLQSLKHLMNGATKSLAPSKWCTSSQHQLVKLSEGKSVFDNSSTIYTVLKTL